MRKTIMRNKRYAFKGMGGQFVISKAYGYSDSKRLYISVHYNGICLNNFLIERSSSEFRNALDRIDDVLEALLTLYKYRLIA